MSPMLATAQRAKMETQVRTPQLVFMQPQRLVVPLFQRPYVWNEENQWEPMWNDIVRVAERVLAEPAERHQPHFLGAVVLQQAMNRAGEMQQRTIIDGQQRLTTLQLLLDALHAELMAVQAQAPAMRLEPLVRNAEPFCAKPEDRFKVWPTNRDRPAFNAVMAADPPVDYATVGYAGERMVEAHRYFGGQASEWLTKEGPENIQVRAAAIETAVRDLIQMVVIDLTAEENAQEIFETLNARGAQLTAADLIKNLVFQRLLETGADVEQAYQSKWKDFETGFWETEVNVGRLRYPRSAIFFNHWLVARTGEEIVAREVFDRFKRYADHEAGVPMDELLAQIHRASRVYREFVTSASNLSGPTNRLGLFGYRTGVLESEVVKPLVLSLLDPEQPAIPDRELTKALDVVESWMVRRMLIRATTKGYNQIFAELIALVRKADRSAAGDVIEGYFRGQTSETRYWPDDSELFAELAELPLYRRLSRGRLRMVLEAVEDHRRGWKDGNHGLGGERVARGKFAIEHVMPRKWQAHWPLREGNSEARRERIIHTLGNLTLLTGSLNSKVSNGPWVGTAGKRQALRAHDVLFLNRDIDEQAGEHWTDEAVGARTQKLARVISEVWPVPVGHRIKPPDSPLRKILRVELADLIASGSLAPSTLLTPRQEKYSQTTATVLPDGRVEVGGVAFATPSDAATKVRGRQTSGWWFFLVDPASRRSLGNVRNEYVDALSSDTEYEETDDDEDDEE
jgi:Protein of unknown function DUF262/Protein of unknown function (DUF1524)/Restriction Enzyme Adenine Methylase Associated